MRKRFLTMSMPINGIFNTRQQQQQQQVHKQRHLKTVNHLWDSGPVLSFMTSARVQMTGIANGLDDLAPFPTKRLLCLAHCPAGRTAQQQGLSRAQSDTSCGLDDLAPCPTKRLYCLAHCPAGLPLVNTCLTKC